MDETENALVALARRGEATALLALWYRYEGALYGIARRYRGVSYEDALQEARTAFWVCILQYDETRGVPFGAYVWRKVRGDVRTAMRRLWTAEGRLVRPSRSPSSEGDTPALWDTAVDGTDPTAGVDDTLAAAELVQAAGLSPRESLAIRLWLDGWSMTEIAQREGVSVETVKTWRKRALAKLRRSASKVAVGASLGGGPAPARQA